MTAFGDMGKRSEADLTMKDCPECGEALHLRSDATGNHWMHQRISIFTNRNELSETCFEPEVMPVPDPYVGAVVWFFNKNNMGPYPGFVYDVDEEKVVHLVVHQRGDWDHTQLDTRLVAFVPYSTEGDGVNARWCWPEKGAS